MARLPTVPDDSLKHLYLMRHGETTWNRTNRIQGHSDPALSPTGRRQVLESARHLRGLGIERMFASDLRRATESARIVERVVRAPITVVPALREINLGRWEGLTPDQVNRRYREGYAKWMAALGNVRVPGAESHDAFCARIRRCWTQVLVRGHERRILIVTHGGVIAALLAHLLHARYNTLIIGLAIDNASITHVTLYGRRVHVPMINHTWRRR